MNDPTNRHNAATDPWKRDTPATTERDRNKKRDTPSREDATDNTPDPWLIGTPSTTSRNRDGVSGTPTPRKDPTDDHPWPSHATNTTKHGRNNTSDPLNHRRNAANDTVDPWKVGTADVRDRYRDALIGSDDSFERVRSEPLPSPSLGARLGDIVAEHAPRLDPGRPGLRVLLALGLLAALVGGLYAWRSQPQVEPLGPPMPVGGPLTPSPAAADGAPPSPPVAAPSPTAQVIVHVTGKVRKPGVITLPFGSRVADAVTAAGGVRAGAGAGGLNLARRLLDGEQIVVGTPQGSTPAALPAPDAAPGANAPLDLNTATPDQLETLPGVGEVLAGRIAEFRQAHAGFRSVDQLRDVSGIGDKKFAELRDKVRI
ncbi:ComEA family DNA-binding protein [Sphaerisporangium corydalis]|uniref:Helix-hairpin-helix domain-containing protein n=1 Tax=Sphaerisporangium corydalis TaxID=1441875 RepID=A0ABV9E705_9ACTN|nr:ComEA family DNA-binding protein [Sphaerisporangium corydalis]